MLKKTTVYQNGFRIGSEFIPIIDNMHWEFQDNFSRTDALRHLQKKYSSIEALNRTCGCSFSYFEEIPFSFERLSELDPTLAIELFSVVGTPSTCINEVKNSNLLVLKNRKFENLLRIKNRFFPLDITFMRLFGLKESQVVRNLSEVEVASLKLKESLISDLDLKKVNYRTLGSEAIFEDLKNFKVVVLDSDLFVDDEIEYKLRKFAESGGLLVNLRSSATSKSILSDCLLKADMSMNVGSSHLIDIFSVGQGRVVTITLTDISDSYKAVSVADLISKSSGVRFNYSHSVSNEKFRRDLGEFLPSFTNYSGEIERGDLKRKTLSFLDEVSKNSLDRSHISRLKSALESL